MDQPLCETFLTGSKLENLLHTSPNSFINGHRLQSVQANVIGVGQGFTSKILRLSLKWTDSKSADTLPKSLIAKIINHDSLVLSKDADQEEIEKMNRELHQIHNIECIFYNLDELSGHLVLPKCYVAVPNGHDGPGIIILEDMDRKGISMPPQVVGIGLNSTQLHQVLDALTTLHAWSLNTTVDWKSTVPKLKDIKVFQTFQNHLLAMFPSTKKAYPEHFEGLDQETLGKFLNPEKFLEIFDSDPMDRYGLPTVLVHGDCILINMLFERKGDGYGDLVCLIDWQAVHHGCGIEDVAKLVALSTSIEIRRKEQDNILIRYVELFNKKIQNPSHRISLENVKRAYEEMFAYQTLMFAEFLGIVDSFIEKMSVDEEKANEIRQRLADYYGDNFKESRKFSGF